MNARIRKQPWTERPAPFLFPAFLLLGCVAVYPLANTVWLSFHRRLLIFDISRFVGLENYRHLWIDERFWGSLWNTMSFTFVSVILELVLGLVIAVILHRNFAGKGLLLSLVLIPWAIPSVVSARMWEWMYSVDSGIINYVLQAKINWLGSPAWAMPAAICADVWKATPFVVILLASGLKSIPHELYEAAQLDGASGWNTFFRITLPLLRPFLLVAAIFRTLDSLRVFDVIYVLTGGGPANTTETVTIYAYKTLFQTLQFGYGSAISVSLFLVAGSISLLYVRHLRVRSH